LKSVPIEVAKSLGVNGVVMGILMPNGTVDVKRTQMLVDLAGERMIIMPGSGINEHTVLNVVAATGAKEFHMSAKKRIDGMMEYRKPGISMGGKQEDDEYHRWVTDSEQVRKVVQILSRI